MPQIWLENTHPDYDRCAERDTYALDHLTGDAREKARAYALTLTATTEGPAAPSTGRTPYLVRRALGESVEAYQERAALSRYPMHMSKVVGAYTGQLEQAEANAERAWGPVDDDETVGGLGDPKDADAIMHRLWSNIDGSGLNYPVLRQQAASALTTVHRLWYLVAPMGEGGEVAAVRLFDPRDVVNWIEADGRPVQVLVRESVDPRQDLKAEDQPGAETQYVLYSPEGWERWRVKESENGAKRDAEMIGEGAWSRAFLTPDGRERLPVGYVELPLAYDCGYNVAQGANYLYNLASDVRLNTRLASHNLLAGDVDDDQWENTLAALQRGQKALQGAWQFIGPSPEYTAALYEIYQQEVRSFYVEAFQQYEDAAKERTATEIRQEEESGRFSFLALLAKAMDEFENDVLHLLTQIYFPDAPDLWGSAHVDRGADFRPLDGQQQADRLWKRYFGEQPVPVGQAGTLSLLKRLVREDNIAAQDDELEAEAQRLAERGAVDAERTRLARDADRRYLSLEDRIEADNASE